MSLRIQSITDYTIWNNFTGKHSRSFLQSWEWGETHRRGKNKVFRFGFYDGETLVAVAFVVLTVARRGAFFFIPHGPVIAQPEQIKEVLSALTTHISELRKEHKALFLRVSSPLLQGEGHEETFRSLKYRPAPIYMHAEESWELPLGETEENLLKGMRKGHRYAINRATRDGVVVTRDISDESLQVFCEVYNDTVKKNNFTPFSFQFLKNEMDVLNKGEDESVRSYVYLAHSEGDILSAAIIVHAGKGAFYHHGANSLKNPKSLAGYALQWRVIQDAKKSGKEFYNLWGVTLSNDPKHPWAGFSAFKRGFGGHPLNYVHAQDLVFSYKYVIPYAIDRYRLWKRGV